MIVSDLFYLFYLWLFLSHLYIGFLRSSYAHVYLSFSICDLSSLFYVFLFRVSTTINRSSFFRFMSVEKLIWISFVRESIDHQSEWVYARAKPVEKCAGSLWIYFIFQFSEFSLSCYQLLTNIWVNSLSLPSHFISLSIPCSISLSLWSAHISTYDLSLHLSI